ncbi:MAG TPA: DNA repair protein RecN [Solirubrobacteraceae bacterium]|nr:DNA repair protein RecN [Solirubrobacteraceae bacterium]
MLLELSVQNLLLIEEARLELAAGLNVITGETGAGKTVLAHALDLLLGGRARPGIVRPGAGEAYVEGIFERPQGFAAEQLAVDAGEVALARRVGSDGRTRAYLNGRSIQLAELRELAGELLSFYGQHEHRRLMLSAAQLEILDGSLGAEQTVRRSSCATAWSALREARDQLERLQELAGARERQLDLLEFELGEIEQVGPSEQEREELLAERDRLRNVEGLRLAAGGGEQALGEEDTGGVRALIACRASLEGAAALDREIGALAERAQALEIEAQDLLSEIRRYGEGLESEPGRLEVVEERLAAIGRLERKHGGSVAAVLEHAEFCRARREELIGAEVAMEAAAARLESSLREHAAAHMALSEARAAGAPTLAGAVRERLAELGMAEASFEVALVACEPGRSGAEHAQFEIAPNPGVPAAPLREIASGGELSRVMLALLSAAHGGGSSTLVFDEIDAGIGGHTARAVGEQLRALAQGRQILAITHLPQVASFAARHFTIAKDLTKEPARARVVQLADGEVLGELVRMLGADEHDAGARRHAKELLRAA